MVFISESLTCSMIDTGYAKYVTVSYRLTSTTRVQHLHWFVDKLHRIVKKLDFITNMCLWVETSPLCLLNIIDGKVQSITTIFYFISYERESIAKLQFSTTCFSLFGYNQVVLLPVKKEIYTIWRARGGGSYWWRNLVSNDVKYRGIS
jgi:hypothetical protein